MRLHVAASVQDVVVQDLRARKEHSLVLVPHGGEDFCTLELAFTSFVDPRRAGPRLNILVQVRPAGWQLGQEAGVKAASGSS